MINLFPLIPSMAVCGLNITQDNIRLICKGKFCRCTTSTFFPPLLHNLISYTELTHLRGNTECIMWYKQLHVKMHLLDRL